MNLPDLLLKDMAEKVKKNWFARLFDMNDTSVSSTNVFLFVITLVSIILLIVPAIVLLVEVFNNKTIATDLSGMAAYIAAVVGLLSTGGLTKAWINHSNKKFNADSLNESTTDDSNFIELS